MTAKNFFVPGVELLEADDSFLPVGRSGDAICGRRRKSLSDGIPQRRSKSYGSTPMAGGVNYVGKEFYDIGTCCQRIQTFLVVTGAPAK
jgi:hypothetical protein